MWEEEKWLLLAFRVCTEGWSCGTLVMSREEKGSQRLDHCGGGPCETSTQRQSPSCSVPGDISTDCTEKPEKAETTWVNITNVQTLCCLIDPFQDRIWNVLQFYKENVCILLADSLEVMASSCSYCFSPPFLLPLSLSFPNSPCGPSLDAAGGGATTKRPKEQ